MLRDVSGWSQIGHGGDSTLPKEELESPDGLKYLIKYPRITRNGVSWEELTELIAAKIGENLGLEMMKVEIVNRHGKRGCLLRNFLDEFEADNHAEGGVLLEGHAIGYNELQSSSLIGIELIEEGFQVLETLEFWNSIKSIFIDMLIFDILIGNQDRHPYNWQIIYFGTDYKFSPIYDSGASLGFRFDDQEIYQKISDVNQLDGYFRRTRVKAGIFKKKQVKAYDLMSYLQKIYPYEFAKSIMKIQNFNLEQYRQEIKLLDILSEGQERWLEVIIPHRRKMILEWVEEENHGCS